MQVECETLKSRRHQASGVFRHGAADFAFVERDVAKFPLDCAQRRADACGPNPYDQHIVNLRSGAIGRRGSVVHAGDRVAGGPRTDDGQPGESGRVRVRVSAGSGSFRRGRPMTFFVQFKQIFSRDNCGILLDYPIGVWY
jgi:hypothetical protein